MKRVNSSAARVLVKPVAMMNRTSWVLSQFDFAFQAAYIEPEHIKVAVLVVAFEFIHYLGTTGIDRA